MEASGARGPAILKIGNHVAEDRRLRPDRRLPHGGPGGTRRFDRLALLAAVRFPGVLRGPAGQRRARPLAIMSRGRGPARDAPLPRGNPHPGNRLRDRRGKRHGDRLHASPQPRARPGPRGRRPAGTGADADAVRAPLRLRFDRAVGSPHRAWALRRGGPQQPSAPHRGAHARREFHHGGRVYGFRGAAPAVYADVAPLPQVGPRSNRGGGNHPLHGAVVAGLVGALHLSGPVARGGDAIVHYAEGPDLCADGRHPGRRDDLASREDRRRAQLGLSLLLVARRHLHALRADQRRIHGRGAGLAASGCCGRSRARPTR